MINVNINVDEDGQLEAVQVDGFIVPKKNFTKFIALLKPTKIWNIVALITSYLGVGGGLMLFFGLSSILGVWIGLLISLPILASWPIAMSMLFYYQNKLVQLAQKK